MVQLSISRRLKRLLPAGWFAHDGAVYRDAVLGGIGDALAWARDQIIGAKAQTRIGTAAGFWLDLTAWDFFGSRFMRRRAEPDGSFRPRILKEILRPRSTRAAISQAVQDLTGRAPDLFEPWNPGDCGAYDVGTLAYQGDAIPGQIVGGYDVPIGGYDVGALAFLQPTAAVVGSAGAGCYGAYEIPAQIFIRAHRGDGRLVGEIGSGFYDTPALAYGGDAGPVPAFAGYDSPIAGLDVGPLAYLAPGGMYGRFDGIGFLGDGSAGATVTDREIYAVIAETKAAGITAWVQIAN